MKVWLITGSSTGFGNELCRYALQKGDYVIATARKKKSLQPLVEEFKNKILPLTLDVTKKTDIKNAIKKAQKWKGKIDVLVNNAGFGCIGAIEETSDKEFKKLFETNVFGLVAVTQAILPIMRKQRSGHIVNVSSIAGIRSSGGLGAYCASKFAVEAVSEALTQEVEPIGIKVTLIEPGPFRTAFSKNLLVSKEIKEYTQVTGQLKNFIQKISTEGKGSVVKGVAAIYAAVDMKNPPLRFPLGNWAVDGAVQKADQLKKQALENEELSRNCDDK